MDLSISGSAIENSEIASPVSSICLCLCLSVRLSVFLLVDLSLALFTQINKTMWMSHASSHGLRYALVLIMLWFVSCSGLYHGMAFEGQTLLLQN